MATTDFDGRGNTFIPRANEPGFGVIGTPPIPRSLGSHGIGGGLLFTAALVLGGFWLVRAASRAGGRFGV